MEMIDRDDDDEIDRSVSKPLMEKKRRARINFSLEQLKLLLEKHYSHQIQKRKLEKADILELSVKYMKSLQRSAQGMPGMKNAEYQAGFWSCLRGVERCLLRPEAPGEGSGLQLLCELTHVLPGSGAGVTFSTMDSSPLPTSTAGARLDGPPAHPAPGPRRAQQPPKPSALAQAGESALPLKGGQCQGIGGQQNQPAVLQHSPQLWRPW
ncbi:transcription factor HES-3 [Candoia aspera]|uniref:transcription factor HES-3 n=1 Tax=Candoia aspera TaxID=51853 RepID=UPI002FD7DEEA